jgi:hypothetical protein
MKLQNIELHQNAIIDCRVLECVTMDSRSNVNRQVGMCELIKTKKATKREIRGEREREKQKAINRNKWVLLVPKPALKREAFIKNEW